MFVAVLNKIKKCVVNGDSPSRSRSFRVTQTTSKDKDINIPTARKAGYGSKAYSATASP